MKCLSESEGSAPASDSFSMYLVDLKTTCRRLFVTIEHFNKYWIALSYS